MSKKFPRVEIKGWGLDRQTFKDTVDGVKCVWVVKGLIDYARDLPVFEIPMAGLNIYNLYPKISCTADWLSHLQAVMRSDLSYPIILDMDGYVMDGRHRIAKAILDGHRTIKAVRFSVTPPWDYVEKD